MENINVYLQYKPSNEAESNFKINSNAISNIKTGDIFTFDKIFPSNTINETIFNSLLKETIANIVKGINANISILLYGQSSSGRGNVLKGNGGNGLIYLAIKDIFTKLNDPLIVKSSIKFSYFELFNETINDLLDASKKNLDIQEKLARNVIINGLSESIVNDSDKIGQLLLLAEKNENKIPDRKSKTHMVYRIKIEIQKKIMRNQQNIIGYINFIKLAGSENIQKGKNDGNSMNKSISFFKDAIYKLSTDQKSIINLKESKLTRLLQPNFFGNIKTVIICYIIDDNGHYQENINILNFGIKAKCVKLNMKNMNKHPERSAEKNQLVIRRINSIQTQINQRKEKLHQNNLNTLLTSTAKKKEEDNNNERIAALEKELEDLKKIMSKGESITDEMQTNSINNELYSVTSNTLRRGLAHSEYKTSIIQMSSFSSAIKQKNYNPFSSIENFQERLTSTSTLRNAYFTERTIPNNLSVHRNTNTVYSISNSITPMCINFDFDYPMNNNINVDYTFKENEELKKRITDMRNAYYEIVKNKDEEIMSINKNHEITMNECEKLINEAEEKYFDLKQKYEITQSELIEQDETIYALNIQSANQDASIKNLKDEIAKIADINVLGDLDEMYNKLKIENDQMLKEKSSEINEIYNENERLKKEFLNNQKDIDDKEKEYIRLKEQLDQLKKGTDKELLKLKSEIKFLKNIQLNKTKNSKGIKQTITDYEDKITKLKAQKAEYKEKLEDSRKYKIPEYENLLEKSFNKITDLNNQLNESQERVKLLKKTLNFPSSIHKENQNNIINNIELSPNDSLLGKKRKLDTKDSNTSIS